MLCLGRTECLGDVPTEEPGVVWWLRRHSLRKCELCIFEYATEGGLSKDESSLRLIWSGARKWRDLGAGARAESGVVGTPYREFS